MNRYIEQVDQAYQSLSGGALEKQLLDVLNQCLQSEGVLSLMSVSMHSELGAYYRGQYQLEKSEGFFLKAKEIMERLEEDSSTEYATVLNNLAGTHRLMGRLEDARAEFQRSASLYQSTVGENSILYAAVLNNLGLVYLQQGEVEQAETFQRQAAEILRKHSDCMDEYAASLCNWGAVCYQEKHYDEASKVLLEAVTLFEEKLGTRTPHYHAALNCLGLTALASKDFPQTRYWLERALDAAGALYGQEHYEYKAIRQHLELARKQEAAQ